MAEAPKSLVADGKEVIGGSYRIPGRRAVEQKYLENAMVHMRGETPKVVFRGKSRMALWWLLVPPWIPIWLIWAFVTRPRLVVVTDRRVRIFRPGSDRHMSKGIVTLDKPVEVKLSGSGLKLGHEGRIYALIGTFGSMRAAAAEAAQRPG